MAATIYMNADTEILWEGMTDEATGAYINDATAGFVVSTDPYPESNAVANGTGSLSYVSASNGNYAGAIPHDADLTRGDTYYLQITASSSGRYGFREIICTADVQGAGIAVSSGLTTG